MLYPFVFLSDDPGDLCGKKQLTTKDSKDCTKGTKERNDKMEVVNLIEVILKYNNNIKNLNNSIS
jgi:hypothetical protein